ncbi:hypothetical protein [Streptomyces avermitilis]|uniref:hypothetical protein n=1 Tax=Streptomyces avermitilis TaxID=33903 RepID=UPI00380DD0F7
MPLQAAEFFAELCLPFHDHTVVGNTYFAVPVPVPGAPLRLRIDFTRTIYARLTGLIGSWPWPRRRTSAGTSACWPRAT